METFGEHHIDDFLFYISLAHISTNIYWLGACAWLFCGTEWSYDMDDSECNETEP